MDNFIGTVTDTKKEKDGIDECYFSFQKGKKYYMIELGTEGADHFILNFRCSQHCENRVVMWIVFESAEPPILPDGLVIRTLKEGQQGSWAVEDFKKVPPDVNLILPTYV